MTRSLKRIQEIHRNLSLIALCFSSFSITLQALGTAQVIDGLCHLFYPSFYHNDATVGLACAGNIFYGAGLLGILSAYQ
jgi:hypothetical protein